ncbi:MAG: transporter [Halobacteriovoraceae bacterium]|nr:transporter [Halobacteriovoraceae bacterium]|tara:strand:+ start:2364 stop:3020 length:657 start_codon:yes stop_codon:yes gene_type:complete
MEGNEITMIDQIAGFIQNGGIFMGIIFAVWGIGIAIALERFRRLSKGFDVDGASFMNEIQRYVLSNDIQGAIRVCSGTSAALPKVLKNGLKRANQGTEQIQNALDATALEVVPKVERRLGYLQLIANILTLFGLLGTIQGLMTSFGALDSIDASQKAEFLSKGISTAMNTTFLGLLTAISIMVIHAFLTSKADKIINEIDEFSVKLLDLLGTKEKSEE